MVSTSMPHEAWARTRQRRTSPVGRDSSGVGLTSDVLAGGRLRHLRLSSVASWVIARGRGTAAAGVDVAVLPVRASGCIRPGGTTGGAASSPPSWWGSWCRRPASWAGSRSRCSRARSARSLRGAHAPSWSERRWCVRAWDYQRVQARDGGRSRDQRCASRKAISSRRTELPAAAWNIATPCSEPSKIRTRASADRSSLSNSRGWRVPAVSGSSREPR
jgi:hypothetical protein